MPPGTSPTARPPAPPVETFPTLGLGPLWRQRESANKQFNETIEGMKFLLEVTMDDAALAKDPAGELGRILRYWGGNLRHYALRPGDGSAVYDSEYREVGRWHIVEQPEDDQPEVVQAEDAQAG
ncbi:hypothetical protein GCM10027074_15000 [Streptomyces deserti]